MLDKYVTKAYKKTKKVSIEKQKPSSLNTHEIDVAHQLIMLRENPSPQEKDSPTLYSKLMKSHEQNKMDSPMRTISPNIPLIPRQHLRSPPKIITRHALVSGPNSEDDDRKKNTMPSLISGTS